MCSWSIIKSLCFLHQFPTSLKMSLKMPLPFSNWSERQVWCSWNRINLELLWEIFDKISRIPLLQYNYSHFHKWTRLLPNAHLIKTKCTINLRYMENGRQNNSKLWCQEIQIHTALTTEKKIRQLIRFNALTVTNWGAVSLPLPGGGGAPKAVWLFRKDLQTLVRFCETALLPLP